MRVQLERGKSRWRRGASQSSIRRSQERPRVRHPAPDHLSLRCRTQIANQSFTCLKSRSYSKLVRKSYQWTFSKRLTHETRQYFLLLQFKLLAQFLQFYMYTNPYIYKIILVVAVLMRFQNCQLLTRRNTSYERI